MRFDAQAVRLSARLGGETVGGARIEGRTRTITTVLPEVAAFADVAPTSILTEAIVAIRA